MVGFKHEELISTAGGVTTTMAYDEQNDRLMVKNSADVQANLDALKEIRNGGLGKGKDMHFVGSIPVHMLEEMNKVWKAEGRDPRDELRKWLNDSENAYFRASETRI